MRKEQELAQIADDIKRRGRQTVENAIAIGKGLIRAKKLLGHGKWLPWLKKEFGWHTDTANRYVRCAKVKLRTTRNLEISISALAKLGRPTTPEPVRNEMRDRIERGEAISMRELNRRLGVGEAEPEPEPEPSGISELAVNLQMFVTAMERVLPVLTEANLNNEEEEDIINFTTKLERVTRAWQSALRRRRRGSVRVIEGGRND